MQLATPKVSEVFGDTSDATEVSIKMNAFTFEALSGDKLYKNMKRAIVREVACNAYDAHIMAGTQDKPFDVHLPTDLAPFLAFRDYGIGLDDNGVRKVFLTYFDSTKRNDNTVIGAWGLGSKSPLGYTDNFTIRSFKDGVCRTYCVFKKPDTGIPAVTKLSESDTSEPNGLHIQIPVINRNDFAAFRREAEDVLRWFPVKPNINIEHKFVERKYIIRDIVKGVHYFEDSTYGQAKAIQGLIEYPINLPDDSKISEDVRGLLRYKLEMHFALGELQFSMSREELSYSEHTLRSIENKLREVKAGLIPKMEAELAMCKTDWEKACKIETYMHDSGNILRECMKDALAAGKSPLHSRLLKGVFGVEDGIVEDAINGVNLSMNHIDNNHRRRNSNRKVAIRYAHKRSFQGGTLGYMIDLSPTTLFVLDDVNKRSLERMRLMIEQHNAVQGATQYRSVMVFSPKQKGTQLSAVGIAEVELFLKKMGNPPVLKVSDMPVPAKVIRNVVSKGDLLTVQSTSRTVSWQTMHSDVPANDKKFYVELSGSSITSDMFSEWKTEAFNNFVYALKRNGFINEKALIAGVRKSTLPAIKADKTWLPLNKQIEKIAKAIGEKRCINVMCRHDVDHIYCDVKGLVDALGKDAKVLADVLASTGKMVYEGREATVTNDVVELLKRVGLVKSLDNEVKIVSNCETAIDKKYPMLYLLRDHMNRHTMEKAMPEVISYIKLVQSTTK